MTVRPELVEGWTVKLFMVRQAHHERLNQAHHERLNLKLSRIKLVAANSKPHRSRLIPFAPHHILGPIRQPMLAKSVQWLIPPHEITVDAIRAQGSGGQHVNKVATAVHLRFDINASSLPAFYKERLLALADHRISKDGVIIIKAQQFRTLEKNKEAAYDRLQELVNKALAVPKKRKPTKPTKGSRLKRLDGKARQSKLKALRAKVKD